MSTSPSTSYVKVGNCGPGKKPMCIGKDSNGDIYYTEPVWTEGDEVGNVSFACRFGEECVCVGEEQPVYSDWLSKLLRWLGFNVAPTTVQPQIQASSSTLVAIPSQNTLVDTPPPAPPPQQQVVGPASRPPGKDPGLVATEKVVGLIPVVGPLINTGAELLAKSLGLGGPVPFDPWRNPDDGDFLNIFRSIRDDTLATDPNGNTWTIRGTTIPLTDQNRPQLIALQREIRTAMACGYDKSKLGQPTIINQPSPPPPPTIAVASGAGSGTGRKLL